jgi:hypothetical protein
MFDIDRAGARAIIEEVAPHVERLTGWDVLSGQLGLLIIPKERAFEEIALGRLERIGVPVSSLPAATNVVERVMSYVLRSAILAAYDPTLDSIFIVRDNVDEANLDGLKVILGHELVHRGQAKRYPAHLAFVDATVREMMMRPKGLLDLWQKTNDVNRIMTLIEGHATWVHEQLQRIYPNARIRRHHFSILTALLRIVAAAKVHQYTAGKRLVAQAGDPASIEELYRVYAPPA